MARQLRGDGAQLDLLGKSAVEFAPGAFLLPALACDEASALLADVDRVVAASALRRMRTPGGRTMSVQMTNCGDLGWISDARGYRYSSVDPQTGAAWPALPSSLRALATRAAERAGYAGFDPDACLVNRYEPGARMTLHQDSDERDFAHPIVSVSLGLPATFLFGGTERGGRPLRVPLAHGDVVVWGGPSRLRFHGVLPLAAGHHPRTGACRINLTLRRAG